jgi:hypothetical protein
MFSYKCFFIILTIVTASMQTMAVSSKVINHTSREDFTAKDAQTENVIINSYGEISLSRKIQTLADDFNDSWVINSLAIDKNGVIYLGTSPNGAIYKYDGKISKIYGEPALKNIPPADNDANSPQDANDPNAASKKSEKVQSITNKHIFAMAVDEQNNLFVGISGQKAQLLKYDGETFNTVFEPNDANYIFAIACKGKDKLYLGTGPKGNIYEISKNKKNYSGKILYQAKDKNILSLATNDDGFIYAGCDDRGLVYKIDTKTGAASVLYDSAENDITALAFDSAGNLYAASTSEAVAKNQAQSGQKPGEPMMPGRKPTENNKPAEMAGGLRLQIANVKPDEDTQQQRKIISAPQPSPKGPASHVYKIDKAGAVQDVYSKVAIFFAMDISGDVLATGSGNNAELFTLNLSTERDTMYYQDKTASQILAIKFYNNDIYIATGNPAKLLKIESAFSTKGEYSSPLVDAGQPAKWGKLQIEADVPPKTQLYIQARTGNVADANDSTFSQWTKQIKMTAPVELDVPRGRFCQYKVIFESDELNASPTMRQAAVAYAIDNLPPKVLAVDISPEKDRPGIFNVKYTAQDDNSDTLIYRIELKKNVYQKWIELEKDYDKDVFAWDSRTVEDGRYEINITASDVRSNNPDSKLTGSRVSDEFVVDNTAPEMEFKPIKRDDKNLSIQLQADDKLSVIENMQYTINSNKEWKRLLPNDMVYDTLSESFELNLGDIEPGTYVIAFKVADAAGNISYKSVEVNAD